MTANYPKEAQNPPTIPGARPDQQPEPRVRVPDTKPAAERDQLERKQNTQEEPESGLAVREVRALPADDPESATGEG